MRYGSIAVGVLTILVVLFTSGCDGADDVVRGPLLDPLSYLHEFVPGPIGPLYPESTGPHKDFRENGPDVTLTASLAHDGQQIYLDVTMHAKETGRGATEASGTWRVLLFSVAEDETILEIVGPTGSSQCSYTDDDYDYDYCVPSSSGPVRTFKVKGDTRGKDLGQGPSLDNTHCFVELHPIQLTIRVDS